jgi:RNA polymerase sigma-70 factor (ECF subfamily)
MGAARAIVTHRVADPGSDGPGGPTPEPPAAPEGETELIRRVQQGDREAFSLLVTRHMPRAYAVAFRVVRHREDAEDMVQEGFVAALKNIDRFELGRPFAPWLHRIIVNRAISARRSRAFQLTDSLPEQQAGASESPLTLALRGEVMDRFRATLADLPERQRVVIELHDVDGFSAEEIGERLGIAAGTVRWYIHQARRTLRSALAPFRGTGVNDDE